jgi:hypothetical protein
MAVGTYRSVAYKKILQGDSGPLAALIRHLLVGRQHYLKINVVRLQVMQ